MTSFNESEINRDGDGKFAPKTTSETSLGALDGSNTSLREITAERYPVDAPDVASAIGVDSATTHMSDWNEVSVRAHRAVGGFDAVEPSTESAHRRLTDVYVSTRFGAELGDEGLDDDGNADLMWRTRHDGGVTLDDLAEQWSAHPGSRELDNAMSGRATSVGDGLRETYQAWGVDPDGSTSRGEVVRPDLHSQPVSDQLAHAPIYRKQASVKAVQATSAGTLTTTLADGSVETTKDYAAGDYIVTNPDGEQYTMSASKFADRYDDAGDGTYAAKGRVRATYNPTGHPITVQAPWGEQHGSSDCYIAETYDPDDPSARSTDRYIIAGAEFRNTYASERP